MVIVSLLLIVFLVFHQLKSSCQKLVNPLIWHALAWIFIILLYAFSGIKWATPLTFGTGFYLLLIWILIILGFRFGYRIDNSRKSSHRNVLEKESYLNRINTKKYAVIAIVSGVIWGVNAILNNELQFGIRLDEYRNTLISQLALVTMGFGFFVWQYELLQAIKENRKVPLRAFLCLAVYILPNMIYAGRQCILVGGITTIIIYFYAIKYNRNYRYNKTVIILALAVIILVVIYFIFITEIREGLVDRVKMYERMFNSNTPDELVKLTKACGPFERILLQLVYYYAGVLPGFETLFQSYNGPTALGAFQLQYISRRIPGIIGQLNELARMDMERFSSMYGMFMPIYRTYLRGFIIDFGRIGTPIIVFLTATLFGKSRKHFVKYPNDFNIVMQVMLCAAAVFSIEYSPLYDGNTWAYPFFCIIAVGIWEKNKLHFTFGKKRLKDRY